MAVCILLGFPFSAHVQEEYALEGHGRGNVASYARPGGSSFML